MRSNKDNKFLLIWLLINLTLIIMMVAIGGITRLTDSGLSMTDWRLFMGIIPPLSESDWINHFSQYKKTPEFILKNFDMTLTEFKKIFFWEYLHRIWGRLIGLVFFIPLTYFWLTKKLKQNEKKKFFILTLIGFFQAFMGWFMVKSGLHEKPDVSHFRLSAHLFIAFLILSCLIWYYLNLKNNAKKNFLFNDSRLKSIKFLIFFIFLQIIFGAFVSGLDAGMIYQTWPLMNESYFPSDVNFKDYRNFLDLNDRSVVQFIHRNVAYLILIIIIYIGFKIKELKMIHLYKSYSYLLGFIFIQIILGVLALISNLHIAIASMHQISSIFLIIFSLNFYFKSIN